MPGYGPLKCRLVQPADTRYTASWHWDGDGGHRHFAKVEITADEHALGLSACHDRLRAEGRVGHCECGAEPPPDLRFGHGMGSHVVWNTEDGALHPGDMFWASWLHHDGKCYLWDDCTDPRGHLIVVLPNGHQWDTDSRASNCTLPDDRRHRCWQRTGDPPNVTAGKGQPTRSAGAGSIASGDYHGFLRDGVLTAG